MSTPRQSSTADAPAEATGPDQPTGSATTADGDAGPPPAVVERSLRHSIKDAAAWAFMQGAAGSNVATFVVLERVGLWQVAAVAALPALFGGLTQWAAANVTDRVSRRNQIVVPTAVAQALVWLPMCGALFLPFDRLGYWVILAGYILYIALGNFPVPAWQSIMGDLVPPARRGRYFGIRNGIAGSSLMASFFLAGWWITLCQHLRVPGVSGLSGTSVAFLVIFVLACAARLVSAWYLSRIYEPPYRPQPSDRFSLLDFIRRAPRAHFGRFVLYCMSMHVGIGLVQPFLAWYLIDQLHYAPGWYAAVQTTSFLLTFGTQPLWGRLIDRIGSKRVLSIGGLMLIGVPLLLMFCRSLWQFAAVMAFEGIALGAFQIAMVNYLFDSVTPAKRARCAAYQSLFLSLGLALGAAAGALVGTHGPVHLAAGGLVGGDAFMLMLLAATTARLLANVALLWSFQEFRLSAPKFPPPKFGLH
ncbi:MAG: MFS transporter [Phycisphaerales bacterium]|nr:MFS transporter [Phycisphaerales bacterium]